MSSYLIHFKASGYVICIKGRQSPPIFIEKIDQEEGSQITSIVEDAKKYNTIEEALPDFQYVKNALLEADWDMNYYTVSIDPILEVVVPNTQSQDDNVALRLKARWKIRKQNPKEKY
jgi:seryl-tRNA synthetase